MSLHSCYKALPGSTSPFEKSEVDLAEKPEAVDVVLPPTYQRLAL